MRESESQNRKPKRLKRLCWVLAIVALIWTVVAALRLVLPPAPVTLAREAVETGQFDAAVEYYRHHLANAWFALVIALAFMFNYAGQWMMHETFHPEVMAVTPILFAYVAFLKKRWWLYTGLLVYAVAWKEDVALAVFMVGFLVLVRGERRIGGATMVAALGWFLLATQVLIPLYSPEGNFTNDLFGDLGSSPTDMVATSAQDPSIPIEHLNGSSGACGDGGQAQRPISRIGRSH